VIRVRFWMWAGRLVRWYADHHKRIACEAYELSAQCFAIGDGIASEIEARLH
jgi:hypothetical protein